MAHSEQRRSAGEGSVTRRKDGRWQGGLQVDGKRRIVYGKTRSEAAAKLAELKRQLATSGALPDPGKRTLSDLLDAWLEAQAPAWRPVTLESYTKVCAHDIRPAIGALRLARVTPQAVHRLCARLQTEGKARTALKVYRVLSMACTLAVRWGWLAHNPCERVDVPRYRAERKALWTPEELRRFLEGTRDHPLHALWVTALAGGCRLGELLALEWADVDLSAGTLSVTKTRQLVAGQWRTTAPKTRAGERTVTLPAEAVQVLKAHRAAQGRQRLTKGAQWKGGERVFPVAPSPVGRALRGECARLGLPVLSMHTLRHLHASLLLGQGLPVPAVSARLGHAHPGVTMTVYAHALHGQDDAAAQVIGRALAGGAR